MNAIVLVALKRPLTFVVLAILILLFGTLAVLRTATDIFPPIKIPVIAVIWSYNGLPPPDVAGRIVSYYERALTTTVNGIEHIESQSYFGSGVVKVYFQPGTDISAAQAQVTATSQTVLNQMPQGVTPPGVLVFDASSVAVLELQIAGQNMTPSAVYNVALNTIRPALMSVPGVAIPFPYGGAGANVQVDLDPDRLLQYGLSAVDVGNALGSQNVVLPAGAQEIGATNFMVQTNSTPVQMESFNNLPLKRVGNSVVYLRDVAYVHAGGPPQQNIVLVKGQQSVLLQILKTGSASTLSVVSGVKAVLPDLEARLPPGVTITPLNDQSAFVLASVFDVGQEMVIAAVLAGLAVLLFVGSWRSTLIVATSIPLSILSSLFLLSVFGQTINVMTLGGLALAVGVLVDDATVMIENINAHLEQGDTEKTLEQAIIEAANQIVVPTFVSTLCIIIVWVPLFQLGGVAGYLFVPLAEAIIFAMVASFILSRTLTPTMAAYLLRRQVEAKRNPGRSTPPGPMGRFQAGFESRFEKFRSGYGARLQQLLKKPRLFVSLYLLGALVSLVLLLFVGENFFPGIKSNTLALHYRAPSGTRIEETARLGVLIDQKIRTILSPHVTNSILNCGLPTSGINQAYSNTGTVGSQDCDITISLDNPASPVAAYRVKLRQGLAEVFPGVQFSFLPGDITAQILNFGLPSPIDVRISGADQSTIFAYASEMAARIEKIAGAADVRVQQIEGQPTLLLTSDRGLASATGLTEANVADNVLTVLSGSGQVTPTYWLDTSSGVSHLVNLQAPPQHMASVNDLQTITVDKGDGNPSNGPAQIIGALSQVSHAGSPGLVSHYAIQPVIDIYANVEGRDLGAVSGAVQNVIQSMAPTLPKGSKVVLGGQFPTMNAAYFQLLTGLAMSIALVYFIIVVNFQSWLDPFIIISALPAALAGIVWALFLTGTTLSVPALTGAIMCMGTATANTILVVAFARDRLDEHGDAAKAAAEAGVARMRPVLMTALAMIIGMFPMSFSNTQNAPLARAVIGGLLVATFTTLLFVPNLFAILHRKTGARDRRPRPSDAQGPAQESSA
jgi:CzcA family heavy metal efflux pump